MIRDRLHDSVTRIHTDTTAQCKQMSNEPIHLPRIIRLSLWSGLVALVRLVPYQWGRVGLADKVSSPAPAGYAGGAAWILSGEGTHARLRRVTFIDVSKRSNIVFCGYVSVCARRNTEPTPTRNN